MEFTNLFFLFLFLPLGICIYYLTPGNKGKNIVLLILSLLFYAYGDIRTLSLIILLSVCNYLLGKQIPRHRLWLSLSVSINVLILVFFKIFSKELPLGLSFYTFSLIAYAADIHRKKTEPCKSVLEFFLFVCLFPKLLMGPIVRYEELKEQLRGRIHEPSKVYVGCARFFLGLGSKVLLADPLYEIYSQLMVQNSTLAAWGGAGAFMLYIYFEFSGYAHMAIGLAKIFGFDFCENFHRPYLSCTVSDFWRRWHISLGACFRDYVYIPLGGNRKGIYRQWLNLFVVWLLTGLWHGTTLPFLLWGMYFFLLFLLEKTFMKQYRRVPKILRFLVTQFFVLMGWVIFAAKDGPALYYSLARMFLPSSGAPQAALLVLKNRMLLLGLCLFFTFPASYLEAFFRRVFYSCKNRFVRGLLLTISGCILLAILLLCTASLLSGSSKPSMYALF